MRTERERTTGRSGADALQARVATALLAGVLIAAAAATTRAQTAEGQPDAEAAFARLAALAGQWEGTRSVDGNAASATYRLASNGTVVMETLHRDTPNEMVSMYHIVGDELVATHYCADGNQPRLVLTRATAYTLEFDFAGGENIDVAVDGYIHAIRHRFGDDGVLESSWFWQGGHEGAHPNVLTLRRAQ